MSSPIGNIRKSLLQRLLVGFHQKASHSHRISVLTDIVAQEILGQLSSGTKTHHDCLDVGCGDMVIAENIAKKITQTNWKCIDIHPLPENLKENPRWEKYSQFDGKHIPFQDKSFDVVAFCDVLHHAGENTGKLLTESARTARIVIIKDHFENGIYSRTMLQLMDFVGNWAYGVNIPKKYFTRESFAELCENAGLELVHMNDNIQLYKHLPLLRNILLPKWQFVATLRSKPV